jgi:hypothetical protein
LRQNEEDVVLACGRARGGGGVENGASANLRLKKRARNSFGRVETDPFRTGKHNRF